MTIAPRPFAPSYQTEAERTRMGGMKKRGPSRRPSKHGKPSRDPADVSPEMPNRRKHQRWARQNGDV